MADVREARRYRSPAARLGLVSAAAIVLLLAHVGVGSVVLRSPLEVLNEIARGPTGDTGFNDIVWQLRLPRALGCMLIGGILGSVGSALQALFRNPLADPYVVGVSSGAAAGGTLAILLGLAGAWWNLGTMILAFAGGLGALGLVFAISGRRGAVEMKTMLLAGVVVGSLLAALLAFMLQLAGQDSNVILRWLLGSTSDMFWNRIGILAVALVAGLSLLVRQSKGLNAFAVGESTAQRLGVDIERLKLTVLLTGSAMTAVAVGTAGIIPFLGLVAPHLSRRILGTDWRISLPGSALVGAGLLLAADIVAQRAIPGQEVQVGIVTALIGAPFLLALMRKA